MDPIHFTAAHNINPREPRDKEEAFYEIHGAPVMRLHIDTGYRIRAIWSALRRAGMACRSVLSSRARASMVASDV